MDIQVQMDIPSKKWYALQREYHNLDAEMKEKSCFRRQRAFFHEILWRSFFSRKMSNIKSQFCCFIALRQFVAHNLYIQCLISSIKHSSMKNMNRLFVDYKIIETEWLAITYYYQIKGLLMRAKNGERTVKKKWRKMPTTKSVQFQSVFFFFSFLFGRRRPFR